MEEENIENFIEKEKNSTRKVKAEVIRVEKDYILSKEGKEGFEKVKRRMKELGVDLDFEKLNSVTWEKEWKNSAFIAICKEVFNWSDEDIFEMGRNSPRASFFIKTMIQYFVSVDAVFDSMGEYWRKHHDFGELEPVELNKEEKYIIARKKFFQTHPVMCSYHAGYFKGVLEFVIKSKEISVKEVKCMHKGDPYHEYLITWE